MLSLEQDAGRRIWVILDELPTLHQVPSLQSGLAESRQFGGCFVLGVQVASALRDLYGKNGAETISGLCGTRVVFAAPDRDTAHRSAESLGRSEVEELSEGVSYGADPYRDGVTLMPRRELQSLALPSELGLSGEVDPEAFRKILQGEVLDGSGRRLGRNGKDGQFVHCPGRDLTLSAPKSVSLAALVGGDDRMLEAHDRAVKRTLEWVERHVAETRVRDPATGAMKRVGGQKLLAATFRHGISRTNPIRPSGLRTQSLAV